MNAIVLLFVLGSVPLIDDDLYMNPHLEDNELSITNAFSIQCKPEIDKLLAPDKLKLLYHINKLTSVYWLYIPLLVALNILAITHGESYPSFSYCYKIIAHS